jgi:hypothetical protein
LVKRSTAISANFLFYLPVPAFRVRFGLCQSFSTWWSHETSKLWAVIKGIGYSPRVGILFQILGSVFGPKICYEICVWITPFVTSPSTSPTSNNETTKTVMSYVDAHQYVDTEEEEE